MQYFTDYVTLALKRKLRITEAHTWFGKLTLKGQLIAAIGMLYPVLNIFYDFNIHWFSIFDMPFGAFYREEVLPFITKPVNWVGFPLSNLYLSLVGFSAIGASVWANAEFQLQSYTLLFFMPKAQNRPGVMDFDMEKTIKKDEEKLKKNPQRLFSVARLMMFVHIALFTWTLLGLLAFVAGLFQGVKTFISFFRFLSLTLRTGSNFEKYMKHEIVGPGGSRTSTPESEKFEVEYRKLKEEVENSLKRPNLIPLADIDTIKPLIRETGKQTGRIVAIHFVLLILIGIVKAITLI